MKFIRKAITLAVMVLLGAACSNDRRHSVDSQDELDDIDSTIIVDPNDGVSGNDSTAVGTLQGDVNFVLAAADGGLLEVQLGELAKQKGSFKEVTDFANTMITDHGKANSELKKLASKSDIFIPDVLSDKSQQKNNTLAQKTGSDFDPAYIKMMALDHQETIAMFRKEATNGQNKEIRDWAAAKIPTLEYHHKMAQQINNSNASIKGH
jgi:putative membrane protein